MSPMCFTSPPAIAICTTTMQVLSVISVSGSPSLARRSITGITFPRRLITPFTYGGICGTIVMWSIVMISRTFRTGIP